MPTMNVSLTQELSAFVEDEVASGDYVSASEVVRDALRVLKTEREAGALKLELLRREVGQGLADAEADRFSHSSVEDIFDAVIDEKSS